MLSVFVRVCSLSLSKEAMLPIIMHERGGDDLVIKTKASSRVMWMPMSCDCPPRRQKALGVPPREYLGVDVGQKALAVTPAMAMMELVEGRICPPRSMSEVDVGLGEELEGLDLMLMCVARSSCGPRVGQDVHRVCQRRG